MHYKRGLVPKGLPVTIAVSGGVDSVSIAHFMQNGARDISLFHFNHKLRPQNDDMQAAVERFAKDFGLPLVVATAEQFSFGENTSLEAAAREARLSAIIELINNPVVVCHHLGDAMESYLMRCLNGTIVEDEVKTIPPKTQLIPGPTLVRPFLLTRKDNLRSYAKRHGLEKYIVEDETNSMADCRRNFIRLRLLPMVSSTWEGLETIVAKKVRQDYKMCQSSA